MEENILTQHPEGKKGVNISKEMYVQMRQAILNIIVKEGEVTLTCLGSILNMMKKL